MPYRFTIVGDGPTDRALRSIVDWALGRIPPVSRKGFAIEFTTARSSPSASLRPRLECALREFPCDLLLIHRDAERDPIERRIEEIETAVDNLHDLCVPVVPVRMTEAWLLIDEQAIRRAADNPNGRVSLDMPSVNRLENLADPKEVCNSLLIAASEKTGRRKQSFSRDSELAARRVRVADLIRDFSPLERLPAFVSFQKRLAETCGCLK